MAATSRSTPIPRLPPGATPPPHREPYSPGHQVHAKEDPGPNPTRDSLLTRTTNRRRHRTPRWRINGGRPPPPPPVPGGTTRGPPGRADTS